MDMKAKPVEDVVKNENQEISRKVFPEFPEKSLKSLTIPFNTDQSLVVKEEKMKNQKECSIKIDESKDITNIQSLSSIQNSKSTMNEDNIDKMKNQMDYILSSKFGSELIKCLKMTSDEIVKMKTK